MGDDHSADVKIKHEGDLTTTNPRHIRNHDLLLKFLQEEEGASPAVVASWTPEQLAAVGLPAEVPDDKSKFDLSTRVHASLTWASNFISSVRMSLPPAGPTHLTLHGPVSAPRLTPKYAALLKAAEETDGGPNVLGWPSADARKRMAEPRVMDINRGSIWGEEFKCFEQERQKVWDRLCSNPKEKEAFLAGATRMDNLTGALATPLAQEALRSLWATTFKEARLLYIRTAVYHDTSSFVTVEQVQESLEKGEDRTGYRRDQRDDYRDSRSHRHDRHDSMAGHRKRSHS